MTIAAGFPCKEGLVLCADTQETISGYVKTDTEKIRVLETQTFNLAITGAGDTDLLEMTVDEVGKSLTLSKANGVWPVTEQIKAVSLEIFNKHILPYASFGYEDRPQIPTFLIGLQFDSGTLLYKATGTKLRRLREPECVGMGIALGKSLIGQLFDPSVTLAQAGLVAIYVLNQAKRWVDGCGGNSDILLLSDRNRKITRMPSDDVRTLERHFDEFNTHLRPVLIGAADGALPQQEFDRIMQQFAMEMLGLRAKFMESEEFYRRVHQMLGLPIPKELAESLKPSTAPTSDQA